MASANPGRSTRKWNITRHPARRPSEWTGRKFHLGKNKEVFYAEVFALLQVLKISLQRNETGRNYTIFSDSSSDPANLDRRTRPRTAVCGTGYHGGEGPHPASECSHPGS